MALSAMKKVQDSTVNPIDPKAAAILKARAAKDTTKMFNMDDMVKQINTRQAAETKNPKLAEERRRKEDSTMNSETRKGQAMYRAQAIKEGWKIEDRPDGSTVYTVPAKKKEQ